MEQRITANVERGIATLVNDVEHTESQSLNGIAVIKVYFQPNANIQTALAQTDRHFADVLALLAARASRLRWSSFIPRPRFRSSKSVLPATLSANSSSSISATILSAHNSPPFPAPPRHFLTAASSVWSRSILDTSALQAKGLSAVDIVNAINAQNLILAHWHR